MEYGPPNPPRKLPNGPEQNTKRNETKQKKNNKKQQQQQQNMNKYNKKIKNK